MARLQASAWLFRARGWRGRPLDEFNFAAIGRHGFVTEEKEERRAGGTKGRLHREHLRND
jgi:hypothetical protein